MKKKNNRPFLIVVALLVSGSCLAQGKETQTVANPTLKGNGIRHFLIGKNYRREWTTPVSVPVLDFRTEAGGIVPKKEGGGKETRSLQVENKAGKTWALRSVRKYPEKAIPPELKNTVGETLVSDDISASYPFAVLTTAALSKAAGIPYLKNKLVFIPDDPILGQYRDKYKNSLVLMEEREPSELIAQRHIQNAESISTNELIYKLYESSRNRVDELSLLRVRLLDNFVMDFDRHEGQWNWLPLDSAGRTYYIAVPKDRDQAFFTNQGLLPKIVRGKERLPELQGFKAKVEHMNTFNRAARNFDHTFLGSLSEEDWSRETDRFLSLVTDEVIDKAMALQPKEVQGFEAPKIAATLKEKRKYFKRDMMAYYRLLSETVTIVGTNGNEEFLIDKNTDGGVLVTVHALDDKGQPQDELYRRLFDPHVTKEIRLFGLEGDDRFVAKGGKSAIKIRMVGGPGSDHFVNEGNGKKMRVYDVNFEHNTVDKGFANRISADPLNNTYTRLGYNDKIVDIGPAAEISATEGIFLGLKFKLLTRGFRKEPYDMNHVFVVSHAVNSSSIHFRYNGDLMRVTPKTDLLIRGDLMVPTNRTNFFGYGNGTDIDSRLFEHDYYHIRYDVGNLSVLGQTHLTHSFSVSYGPTFEYLNLRRTTNAHRYAGQYFTPPAPDLYSKKYYAGGEAKLLVDTRNNPLIPTRGVLLQGNTKVLSGLNDASHNTTISSGSFSFYTDLSSRGRLVFATIFGGGHTTGRFEPEQAQYLGFTDHLRGYRVQRFAGRSAAYNNTELRLKIADINAWLFPAAVGVYGFHDMGRVWTDMKEPDTWHRGYGGGVWLAPFNRIVVTGYLSFSTEEKALPWVTFGFVF